MNTPARPHSYAHARDDMQALGTSAASEHLAAAGALMAISAAACGPTEVLGSHHLVLPEGARHVDITALVAAAQPTPARKSGTVVLKSADSLGDFLEDHKATAADAVVYADPDKHTIVAVINDNRGAQPGWRDFRATFTAEKTTECALWIANSGKQMDQQAFAEFMEDNAADLHGEAAGTLQQVATTIQAKTGITFSSAKRLHDGQTQLTYSETIDATAGANGELKIPREFELGLRLFKNGSAYRLRARLKYRLASGGIKFWYELDRPTAALDSAFGEYVQALRDKSGFRVLLGAP